LFSQWVLVGSDQSLGIDTGLPLLQVKPSARELARIFRQQRALAVHALGAEAFRLCQRARWLVYPAPALLVFSGVQPPPVSRIEALIGRTQRSAIPIHITQSFEAREALVKAGDISAERTAVIALATQRRESATREAVREHLQADPLRFVIAASFAPASDADPQWMALEILAEMLHRRVPTLLVAATTSASVETAVRARAATLDVATAVHCIPLLPNAAAVVAAADAVLLTSGQPGAAWLTLAALDARVPVIKSPVVRLPETITEFPGAKELHQPLAREDLHTWIDTMEDFRPRPNRASHRAHPTSPTLPYLEDVARDYVELYRRVHRYGLRRRF
jgi:hypothetical protein